MFEIWRSFDEYASNGIRVSIRKTDRQTLIQVQRCMNYLRNRQNTLSARAKQCFDELFEMADEGSVRHPGTKCREVVWCEDYGVKIVDDRDCEVGSIRLNGFRYMLMFDDRSSSEGRISEDELKKFDIEKQLSLALRAKPETPEPYTKLLIYRCSIVKLNKLTAELVSVRKQLVLRIVKEIPESLDRPVSFVSLGEDWILAVSPDKAFMVFRKSDMLII